MDSTIKENIMTTNTTGLPDITKETHDAIFKAPWVIRFMEKTE